MTVTTTRRDRLRHELESEIRAVALRHLATEGGAVSMRAIARDVGISPQGLYRYYDSRDALLTRLIGDAYDSLADELTRVRDGAEVPAGAPDDRRVLRARIAAAGAAYRDWALAHPAEFALISGGPIPGYAAPEGGVTTVAAGRVTGVFLELMVAAHRAGHLRGIPGTPGPATAVARWQRSTAPAAPPAAVHAVLLAWARVHGPVVLEAFGHLAVLGDGAGELFREHLAGVLHDLGFDEP